MDTIFRLLPGGFKEVTLQVFPFGGGHTERGEVVVAKEPGSGILHSLKIEPGTDAQGILTTDCTASVFNPVNVLPPSGIPTGVKSQRNLMGMAHRTICREHAVEGILNMLNVEGIDGYKVGHLSQGVNARIGASSGNCTNGRSKEAVKTGFKFPLNRALVGLYLPALEICAVVFQNKPNVALHIGGIRNGPHSEAGVPGVMRALSPGERSEEGHKRLQVAHQELQAQSPGSAKQAQQDEKTGQRRTRRHP